MLDGAASWVATPGNLALRRTGWAPTVLKKLGKVAKELPPMGGKGPVPFAPLHREHGPPARLHQIATATPPPPPPLRLSLSLSLSPTPTPLCPLQGSRGRRRGPLQRGTGRRRRGMVPPTPTPPGVGQGRGRGGGEGGRPEVVPPRRCAAIVWACLASARILTPTTAPHGGGVMPWRCIPSGKAHASTDGSTYPQPNSLGGHFRTARAQRQLLRCLPR